MRFLSRILAAGWLVVVGSCGSQTPEPLNARRAPCPLAAVTTEPTEPGIGEAIVIRSTGFTCHHLLSERVQVTASIYNLQDSPPAVRLGNTTVERDGSFEMHARIPESLHPGSAEIVLDGPIELGGRCPGDQSSCPLIGLAKLRVS